MGWEIRGPILKKYLFIFNSWNYNLFSVWLGEKNRKPDQRDFELQLFVFLPLAFFWGVCLCFALFEEEEEEVGTGQEREEEEEVGQEEEE